MAEGGLSEKWRIDVTVQCSVCPQHPDAHLIEDYYAKGMVCPEYGLVVGYR